MNPASSRKIYQSLPPPRLTSALLPHKPGNANPSRYDLHFQDPRVHKASTKEQVGVCRLLIVEGVVGVRLPLPELGY